MKRLLGIILVLVIFSTAFAKKLPGDEARDEFVSEFNKLLERNNRQLRVGIDGKSHQIIVLYAPNVPVSAMYEIEREFIEPWKTEPSKSHMKSLGFATAEIWSGVQSESFPKGVWDIPIE